MTQENETPIAASDVPAAPSAPKAPQPINIAATMLAALAYRRPRRPPTEDDRKD